MNWIVAGVILSAVALYMLWQDARDLSRWGPAAAPTPPRIRDADRAGLVFRPRAPRAPSGTDRPEGERA